MPQVTLRCAVNVESAAESRLRIKSSASHEIVPELPPQENILFSASHFMGCFYKGFLNVGTRSPCVCVGPLRPQRRPTG